MSVRMAAAMKGETHYQGSPCKKCGGEIRHVTSGGCVVCSREAARKQRDVIRKAMAEAKARAESEHATYLETV